MFLYFSSNQPLVYELEEYEIQHLQFIVYTIQEAEKNQVPQEAVYDVLIHPLSVRLMPLLYKAHLAEWQTLIRVKQLPKHFEELQYIIDSGDNFYIHYGEAIKDAISKYTRPSIAPMGYGSILPTEIQPYLFAEINRYKIVHLAEYCTYIYYKNPIESSIYPYNLYIN